MAEETKQKGAEAWKPLLITLMGAPLTVWTEHRTTQVRERSDATYAATAPAIQDQKVAIEKLTERVNTLSDLLTRHVIGEQRGRSMYFGGGVGGAGPSSRPSGAGGSVTIPAPADQKQAAETLRTAPVLKPLLRAIPASADDAVRMMAK